MQEIQIIAGELSIAAVLNDSPTAQAIQEALPVEGAANVWGDEIYFEIPVSQELEPDSRAEVEVGELGYWPAGRAFCIFFGPTPVSSGDKPQAYSPVNIIGEVQGDATRFRSVSSGETVRVIVSG